MTDEQFAKLPKWAQREIERLRANEKDLRETLHAMAGGDSPIKHFNRIDPPIDIPERNTVEFQLEHDRIEVSLRNGVVDVRSINGVLCIQPAGSNVIRVWGNK